MPVQKPKELLAEKAKEKRNNSGSASPDIDENGIVNNTDRDDTPIERPKICPKMLNLKYIFLSRF